METHQDSQQGKAPERRKEKKFKIEPIGFKELCVKLSTAAYFLRLFCGEGILNNSILMQTI